jgi:hypothetical protein
MLVSHKIAQQSLRSGPPRLGRDLTTDSTKRSETYVSFHLGKWEADESVEDGYQRALDSRAASFTGCESDYGVLRAKHEDSSHYQATCGPTRTAGTLARSRCGVTTPPKIVVLAPCASIWFAFSSLADCGDNFSAPRLAGRASRILRCPEALRERCHQVRCYRLEGATNGT